MHLATGDHAGPYVIGATLGTFGMGEVYRARDPQMSRDIALTIIPGEFVDKTGGSAAFESSARAAKSLSHPNIAAVFDAGRCGPDWYIASEPVEGKTLRQLLAHGALPVPRVIDIGMQIAEGPAHGPAAGVVHGDLRPENIIVTAEGRVKILNFGLDSHSAEGQAVGPQSDIFSAGVILYEMMAGRRPPSDSTSADAENAMLNTESAELDARTPALVEVVLRCLDGEPARRFETGSELRRALQCIQAGIPGGQTRSRVRQGVTWPAWGVAAGLLTAAVLGGTAFWLGSRAVSQDPPRFTAVTAAEGNVAFANLHGESLVYSFTPEGGEQHTYIAGGFGATHEINIPSGSVVTSISKHGEMAVLLSRSLFGSRLFRQPLSGGSRQPVVDDVYDAQWSPDGSDLAVVRFLGRQYRLEYPVGKVLLETHNLPSRIGVSPDGKQVSVIVREQDGYNLEVASRGEGVVKFALAGDESLQRSRPRWTPDGREIWFSGVDPGSAGTILAVDLQGRRRVVARFPGEVMLEDLSSSGKTLLSRSQSYRRVLMERDGLPVRDLSWNNAFAVALSSDGRRVGLTDYSGTREYYVRSTDGGEPARFERGFISSFSPDGNWMAVIRAGPEERMGFVPLGPSGNIPPELTGLEKPTFLGWLPDSRRFLFSAGPERARSFYMASLGGGAPVPVAGGRASEPFFDSAVAPDGRRLWLLGEGKHWVVEIANSKWSLIPNLSVDDIFIGWADDSRTVFIAAESPDGHLARIDRVDSETGTRKQFKTLPAGIQPGRGALITPDGKTRVYTSVRSVSDLWIAEGLK